MISRIKPTTNKIFAYILAPVAHKLNPNLLSFLTPIAGILILVLLTYELYAFAGLAFLISLIDTADGTVARLNNQVTKFGGFLDASLDRVHESIILIGIGLALNSTYTWLLVSTSIAVSLIISYVKSKAEASMGLDQVGANKLSVGILERTERLVLLGFAIFFYEFFNGNFWGQNIIDWSLTILVVLGSITIIMRFRKAYELLTSIDTK